jgi:hypothetical protein
MSVDARSIGGATTRFTWNGAWIATILLALIFALSMLAMNGGGRPVVDRVPSSAPNTTGEGNHLRPIEVGRSVCVQCR